MLRPPLCTDEPIDRYLSRPLATVVVKLLAPTPITPNGVTVVAVLFGLGMGAALAMGQGLVAVGCAVGYLAFDCADGQLARLRGTTGYLGRAVDGFGDYITAIAAHLGLAFWMGAAWGLPLAFGLTVAAGAAMAWASFLLDRYKRRYRGDTDDLEVIRAEAAATAGIKGWMISTLLPYAVRLDGGHQVTDRSAYQARVRLPMRLWLINGPTMHFAAIALCGALCRPTLYIWIALGPLLLLSLLTLLLQRRLEQRAPAVVEAREA